MSTEYARRITKEILSKVNGQGKLAEQAIRTLITRDPKFLQSLVEPYLDGIILHAIERARKPQDRQTAASGTGAMPKVTRKPATASQAPAQKLSGKGMDGLMAAWAKSFEKDAPPAGRDSKKVSASHLAAIQALVKKK